MKVTANDKFLLENLVREDLLDEDFLKFDDPNLTQTLAIRWNARSNSRSQQNLILPNAILYRRLLTYFARLFDTQGWIL